MNVSNISRKASVLVSCLLVVGLLLWRFQLPEKSMMAKPVKQSQLTSQKATKSVAVASIALPPPPPPASQNKRPVSLKKAIAIKKPLPQKKSKPTVRIKKPPPKPVAVRAVQKQTPKKLRTRTVQVSITDYSPEAKEGRTLLRLLEHSSGPEIEIAWPDGSSARSSLYHLLRNCYGMRTALMDAGGVLYIVNGGRNWRPDMDRFSGFVRQPSGILPSAENKEAMTIRLRYGIGLGATVVRLFPRNIDAILLGGLGNILGGRYQKTKVIRAAYRQNGSRLFIDDITADNVTVRGRIAFSDAQAGCG